MSKSPFSHLSTHQQHQLARETAALVVGGISEAACISACFHLRKRFSDQKIRPRAILSSKLTASTIDDINIRDIFYDPSMRSIIAQEIKAWARNSGLNIKTCSLESLSLYEETNSVRFELSNMPEDARAYFLQEEEQHDAEAKAAAPVAAAPVAAAPVAAAPVANGLLPPDDFWFSRDNYDRLPAQMWGAKIAQENI